MTGIEGYSRYAIFWAPPAGSNLARFGARWLGWDAEAGRAAPQPTLTLPRPLARITRTARRYGFHATLKPPFRLAQDASAAALDHALSDLAARLAPVKAPSLAPATSLGFLALMPTSSAPTLAQLAGTCLRDLDHFRAAPDTAELARRRTRGLTSSQEQNLIRWGYPYVLGDFRFHLTLSDRLRPGEAETLTAAVTPLVAPHLDSAFTLEHICLYGDPGADAGFRLLRRYSLG